jgi:hypothetical protein
MRQALDGVNPVGQRKEGDHMVPGDLVVALSVPAEPVKRGAELAVVEAHQPAVIDRPESRGRPEIIGSCLERRPVLLHGNFRF